MRMCDEVCTNKDVCSSALQTNDPEFQFHYDNFDHILMYISIYN